MFPKPRPVSETARSMSPISESLTPSQYKQILKNGEQFSSLEAAYDAYLKALGDSKYDSVRQS